MLTRAIPATVEGCSVTFDDGFSGQVRYADLLRDAKDEQGQPIMPFNLRHESVRINGSGLEVDRHVYSVPGMRQAGPDKVMTFSADAVRAVTKQERQVLSFTVIGQRGPMTLSFLPLGRYPTAAADVTDEEACKLTQEDAQEWYTTHGWPRAGMLLTRRRNGHYRGLFQMV